MTRACVRDVDGVIACGDLVGENTSTTVTGGDLVDETVPAAAPELMPEQAGVAGMSVAPTGEVGSVLALDDANVANTAVDQSRPNDNDTSAAQSSE